MILSDKNFELNQLISSIDQYLIILQLTDNKFKYIQVCYDLSDESTRNREFNAFQGIDGDKYIITLTKEDYSNNDIKQVYLFDFLMNDDF